MERTSGGLYRNKVRNEDGSTINGVRHEDLQNLHSKTIVLIIFFSLDVLEHIPDYRKHYRDISLFEAGRAFSIFCSFSIEQQENHTMSIMERWRH